MKSLFRRKYPINSEGADFIIQEAMREDVRPLFVLFQGAITDLACAYISKRATPLVWPRFGLVVENGLMAVKSLT